jgi:hypothetical protein
MDGLPEDFMSGFQPSGSLGASLTQGVALGWYMAAPLALNELWGRLRLFWLRKAATMTEVSRTRRMGEG